MHHIIVKVYYSNRKRQLKQAHSRTELMGMPRKEELCLKAEI